MGMFDWLFDNPQRRSAESMSQKDINDWQKFFDEIKGGKSEFSNVSNLSDLSNVFGLSSDLNTVYRPRKAELSTGLARTRSSLASRTGESNATPEAGFNAVDTGYLNALSQLEGQQAQEEAGAKRFNANFLSDILSKKEGFRSNQIAQESAALQGLGGARDKYVKSQSSGSLFGDLSSIAGFISGIPGGWEWISGALGSAADWIGGAFKKKGEGAGVSSGGGDLVARGGYGLT